MFKPTYLYIKQHNITGLKYFGKTTKKDPIKYKGSGSYWKNHVKKHGYDVTTEIIGYYTDEEKCKYDALEFSIKNNITESKEWANQMLEDGIGQHVHVTKEIHSKSRSTILERYGDDYFAKIAKIPKSEKHKENIRKSLENFKNSDGYSNGKWNKGIKRIKIKCPHCSILGAKNTMSRFHFDNCKFKK